MPANWLPVHSEIKKLLRHNEELMLFGGAGSGKTHFQLNVIFKRAMMFSKSRHICFRKRFEHTKHTTWNSAKEHIHLEWPDMPMRQNRSGGTWEMHLPNGSEVLFSGLDDKERIEKHLGSEFLTIYINEASEILDENDIELISSRLRQNIEGARHLLLLDMNPPVKSHWSYKRYIEGPLEGRSSFKINPKDVKENLPSSYIKRLEALPERLRSRFLDGEFLSDVEGALWSYEMILNTRKEQHGGIGRIVVALDPPVTSNENSDEAGIIVAAEKGTGYKVLADRSLKGSPSEWAAATAKAYYDFGADCIVAEVNQGGDLVELALKSVNENLPVKKVRATRGKHIRAEPVASLYEQGLVEHENGLIDLEDQLQSWVPNSGLKSPDRLDALVWAFHELSFSDDTDLSISFL
jgi:hypothetical protein